MNKAIYTNYSVEVEGLYLEPNYKNAKKVAESNETIYLGVLNDVEQLKKARDYLGTIINIKTEKERNEKYRKAWINSAYKEYLQLHSKGKARCIILDNTTIVSLADPMNNDKVVMGKTVCSPEDTFDRKTGIAIAYARAMKLGIPNYI